jgi:hypothetical protein
VVQWGFGLNPSHPLVRALLRELDQLSALVGEAFAVKVDLSMLSSMVQQFAIWYGGARLACGSVCVLLCLWLRVDVDFV